MKTWVLKRLPMNPVVLRVYRNRPAMDKALEYVAAGIYVVDAQGRIWKNKIYVRGPGRSAAQVLHDIKPRLCAKKIKGYLCIEFEANHKRYKVMAHRLVWEVANGFLSHRLQINHKDKNRANNRLDNLEAVTASENVLHSFKTARGHGAQTSPVRTGGRKRATPEDRLQVMALRRLGKTFQEIAKETGISASQACRLCDPAFSTFFLTGDIHSRAAAPVEMSRTERRARAAALVDDIKRGMSLLELSRKYPFTKQHLQLTIRKTLRRKKGRN